MIASEGYCESGKLSISACLWVDAFIGSNLQWIRYYYAQQKGNWVETKTERDSKAASCFEKLFYTKLKGIADTLESCAALQKELDTLEIGTAWNSSRAKQGPGAGE